MSRKNCRFWKSWAFELWFKKKYKSIFYFTPGHVTEREMRETFQSRGISEMESLWSILAFFLWNTDTTETGSRIIWSYLTALLSHNTKPKLVMRHYAAKGALWFIPVTDHVPSFFLKSQIMWAFTPVTTFFLKTLLVWYLPLLLNIEKEISSHT